MVFLPLIPLVLFLLFLTGKVVILNCRLPRPNCFLLPTRQSMRVHCLTIQLAIPISNYLLKTYYNSEFNSTTTRVQFTFKRRPDFVITNLFAPTFILSLLELSSFLLPPDTTDRTTFAATILLSFFVLQDQILSTIPRTPRPVVAIYFTLGQMLLAMLITIYSSAIVWFINEKPTQAMKPMFYSSKQESFKWIDRWACIIIINIFIVFNGSCMIVLSM